MEITQVFDLVDNRTLLHDSTGRNSMIYDQVNRLTGVHNPQNKRLTHAYNAASLRTRMVDPDAGLFTYGYDVAQRLEVMRNPQDQRTTWTRDLMGRVTREFLGNGTRPASCMMTRAASSSCRTSPPPP